MAEGEARLKELARGEELFSQGSLKEAKECFLKLAEGPNPSKEAFNNLGVIAHQEGDFDEALRCFTEALLIDSSYEDAVANYSALLDEIERVRPGGKAGGGPSQEHEALSESHEPSSPEKLSQPGRKARIAVLCLPGLENFLGDIVSFLEKNYEVRTCYSRDGGEIKSVVEWADIIWLEWANELAATLTYREALLDGKPVICRVHSYEVLDGHLSRINWSKITKAIFVAPHVLDIARRMYPKILDVTKAVVISNGVDLDKYYFKEREPGFNLAVVGHVNHKKNPSLWPEILHRLVNINGRYALKVAGAVQEPRYAFYLQHAFKRLGLEKQVRFYGNISNISSWLESENINYLLTTSVFESFGYGIAEAMAMGYRPLINYFPGADELWPEECLFSSIEEAVSMVLDREHYNSSMYRHFVKERYSLERQLQTIATLIHKMFAQGGQDVARTANRSESNSSTLNATKNKTSLATGKKKKTICAKVASSTEVGNSFSNQYSTDNPLGLLLKENENITDYMDLYYFMTHNGASLSEIDLINYLQTIFHRIINSFCNSRTVQQNEVDMAKFILNRLCSSKGLKDPLIEPFSPNSICVLYQFLKRHLPESNENRIISIQKINEIAINNQNKTIINYIYRQLGETFRNVYEKGLISSFIVHGSMATLDYTLFSDLDTQVFITDKAFESAKNINFLAESISAANSMLRAFDPLQHHGYFVSTDLDRRWYPEAYLPLSTIESAVLLLGDEEQSFSLRTSAYENRFSLWHTGYFFRTSFVNRVFPETPFDLKRFLSRFMLLPVLYLELYHDVYPYKRESFSMASKYFDPELWSAFDIATRARENWNPSRLLRFNEQFYRNVFLISEIMLNQLMEISYVKNEY